MIEGIHPHCVAWADATAKQEGRGALIGIEDIPIKLLTIASYGFAFGIKEEVIDESFIGLCLYEVFRRRDVESLDNPGVRECGGAEVRDYLWRFVSVQLDIVEAIIVSQPFHLLRILINEHPYPLAFRWQIVRTLTHIPTGLGPEDKAHHIDTESLHFANVIGLAHAANLYYLIFHIISIFRSIFFPS